MNNAPQSPPAMEGDPTGGDPTGGDPAGGDPAGGDQAGDGPAGGDPAGGEPTGGDAPREISLPVGVVLRKSPGVTRWARWTWQAVALLPGAPPADWRELRREGEAAEYHAATLPLTLHRTEVEAYRVSLSMRQPSAFVVLRDNDDRERPFTVHAITASAYEAQDFTDSGEELVEVVAMPESLAAFVQDFVKAHYRETPFIKRQRDKRRDGGHEDGIGDARIRQTADVYRTPATQKPPRPR